MQAGPRSARPDLLPLRMAGLLSAVIFVLNYGIELLALYDAQRGHPMLLVGLQCCLAVWALWETGLLARGQDSKALRRLQALLVVQIALELARGALIWLGPSIALDRSLGVGIVNFSALLVFAPIYAVLFLLINQSLIDQFSWREKLTHEKLLQSEFERTRIIERDGLLKDVHDGFGSQLVTARLLAERGQLNQHDMNRVLGECITDLHIVVDVLGHPENSLADSLNDFKFRTQARLDPLPLKLSWRLDLDAIPLLPQNVQLQVLRILQEGLTNAIRHAQAGHLQVRAQYNPLSGQLEIGVSDDGVGMSGSTPSGRGIRNMQGRAREIGAQLNWIAKDPGTEVLLMLPIVKP